MAGLADRGTNGALYSRRALAPQDGQPTAARRPGTGIPASKPWRQAQMNSYVGMAVAALVSVDPSQRIGRGVPPIAGARTAPAAVAQPQH